MARQSLGADDCCVVRVCLRGGRAGEYVVLTEKRFARGANAHISESRYEAPAIGHPSYFDPLDVGHPANDFTLVPSIFFNDGERGGSGVVKIREVKDRWAIEVDGMDLPLQKDLRLRVNGGAVTYKVKPEKLPEFIECRLVDWEYQVTDSQQASLELTVEEPTPPISDNRAMGAIALAVLTCLVLVIQFHAFYVHPEYAWAFLGRHAQVWGSIGLAALFAVVLPSRIGLRQRTGFRELFLTAILLWTGAVLIFCGFP